MNEVLADRGMSSLRAFRSLRSLASQMLLLQAAIVLASIVAAGVLSFVLVREQLVGQYQERALALARVVATTPAIVDAFDGADPSHTIQPIAEAIRRSSGASFVVVTDRNGIRYSHPNPERIGERVSTDPSVALAGQEFVGVERGTLGVSVRAKVPVVDERGRVIGIVSLGFLEEQLAADLADAVPLVAASVLAAFALGLTGSIALARRLRRQTFDLGAREIAGLLEEHQELDNVKRLTNALRAQTHEYANKLYTVAGLIELGRYREAVRFITEAAVAHQELVDLIRARIADPVVAALLIAKAAVASERGMQLRIAEGTHLAEGAVDARDLVTVVGNLVDNAMDAVAAQRGWVEVRIRGDADGVEVRVRDPGPGVDGARADEIFREGVTTKPGHHGIGLALVDEVARRHGGWVRFENDGGAVFTASLPREAVRPPGAQTEARSDEVEHLGRARGFAPSEVGMSDEVEHPGPKRGLIPSEGRK
jgi:sensor histidine kinase regulating citrate/malate metabolism